jgi:hypothetical protein
MSLNIPPARRVTPPPLPDLLSAASTRSPLPRTRAKISQGCYEGAGGSSASGSSGNGNSRNSSNVSSCSLDAMSSSSDDDIWGCNGRCKALHVPLQQSRTSFTTNQHTPTHHPIEHLTLLTLLSCLSPSLQALCRSGRRCTRPCTAWGDLLCPLHAAASPPHKTPSKQRRRRRSQVKHHFVSIIELTLSSAA